MENIESLLRKYPNLKPTINPDTGKTYLKYVINDKDELLKELNPLGLTKEIFYYNVVKYGFQLSDLKKG